MTQLTTLNRQEPNPFRPDIPESINRLSPQLFNYLREISETLREQHNLTQAGDSTFSWELLTRVDLEPQFKLGSLGRFYHFQYGIMMARYCRFAKMLDDSVLGAPHGIIVDQGTLDWSVTNDFTKSRSDLVVGVGGAYQAPPNDSYGWLIVSGVNIQSLYARKLSSLQQFDRLVWAADEEVWADTESSGRVLGSILGGYEFVEISADLYEIPPGYAFIELRAESEYTIKQWISDALDNVTSQIMTLSDRVAVLEGPEGLEGFSTQLSAATVRISAVETQATTTAQQFAQRTLIVNQRLAALEASTGDGGVSAGLTNLQNQLTDYQTANDGRVTSLSDRCNAHNTSIGTFETFRQTTIPQLTSLLNNINAINLTLTSQVVGPVSSTDNALVRWDGATGRLVQDSNATLDDVGDLILTRSLHIPNAHYVYGKVSGGTETRLLGLNASNVMFMGGVDAAIVSIQFCVSSASNGAQVNTTMLGPITDDALALGATNRRWSDLFLASGAVINFNAGNFLITHSAGLLTFNNAIDVGGEVRCNSFRIDATPGASIATASTHKLAFSANGSTYYFLLTDVP